MVSIVLLMQVRLVVVAAEVDPKVGLVEVLEVVVVEEVPMVDSLVELVDLVVDRLGLAVGQLDLVEVQAILAEVRAFQVVDRAGLAKVVAVAVQVEVVQELVSIDLVEVLVQQQLRAQVVAHLEVHLV